MYHIDSVAPLSSGQTGLAVTFSGGQFNSGIISALGRAKGFYYKEALSDAHIGPKPQLRFTIHPDSDDPSTIQFRCENCSNPELLQTELLHLLKGVQLVPDYLEALPNTPWPNASMATAESAGLQA